MEETPELQSILGALDDPDCRTIVRHLHEPMTASEVSAECDIPMSTTYRKLETLSDASLVEERTEIRADGHHATQYLVSFDAVSIVRTDGGELEVTVDRPDRTVDERLASIWTEVRREV